MPGLLPSTRASGRLGAVPLYVSPAPLRHVPGRLHDGRPLRDITAAEFRGYLDAYNIKWILAASPEVKGFVAAVAADTTGVPPAGSGSRRRLSCRVAVPVHALGGGTSASFTSGAARQVKAAFDRIEIDTRGSGEPFVLRFTGTGARCPRAREDLSRPRRRRPHTLHPGRSTRGKFRSDRVLDAGFARRRKARGGGGTALTSAAFWVTIDASPDVLQPKGTQGTHTANVLRKN